VCRAIDACRPPPGDAKRWLSVMGKGVSSKEKLEKLDREWMNARERRDSMYRLQQIFAGLVISMVAETVIAYFGYWI
jgi:hypothetical protein